MSNNMTDFDREDSDRHAKRLEQQRKHNDDRRGKKKRMHKVQSDAYSRKGKGSFNPHDYV